MRRFYAPQARVQVGQQPGGPHPAELAYGHAAAELTICRDGDVTTLYPARTGLKDAVAQLRALPRPPEVERREPIAIGGRA